MCMLNSAYDCIPNCYHQSQFHVVASITAVFLLCEEALFAVACCLVSDKCMNRLLECSCSCVELYIVAHQSQDTSLLCISSDNIYCTVKISQLGSLICCMLLKM